jgi:hypothetical protein
MFLKNLKSVAVRLEERQFPLFSLRGPDQRRFLLFLFLWAVGFYALIKNKKKTSNNVLQQLLGNVKFIPNVRMLS